MERVGPPLRPSPEVVAAIQEAVAGRDARVLLLGVTPELSQAFDNLLAVDKNAEMIARWWPGDTPTRHVACANWLTLPPRTGPFSAIIGDGSLSNVAFPQETSLLLRQVRELLEPGGRFACRLFERPDEMVSPDALARQVDGVQSSDFHVFKLRLAMSLAAEMHALVPVRLILETFNRLFPDRDRLAAMTGWPREDIDLIDVYDGSDIVYGFPSRAELLELVPQGFGPPRFVDCGNYGLAECCPVLVLERESA